jgi:hypothetical protein
VAGLSVGAASDGDGSASEATLSRPSGRFVVQADEKLTAFVELESAIRAAMKQELHSFSQNV